MNLHTPAAGCGMFDTPTPTNAEHERHYDAMFGPESQTAAWYALDCPPWRWSYVWTGRA